MEPIAPPLEVPRASGPHTGLVPDGVLAALARSRQLQGFSLDQVAAVAALMRPVSYQAGELVYREGTVPEGMYVIEEGDVQLWKRWTDSRQDLVRFSGGNALCASSLISSAGSTANAECLTACRVWVLDQRSFNGLRLQLHPVAFGMLNSGVRGMASAIRGSLMHFRKVFGHSLRRSEPVTPVAATLGRPLRAEDDALLRALPALRAWADAEVEALKQTARLHELARGQTLFNEGDPAAGCYLVMRGAIEAATRRGERRYRHGLRGPGGLCGHEAFSDTGPQLFDCVAREKTFALEISRDAFDALLLQHAPLAMRILELIGAALSAGFGQAILELTRDPGQPAAQASISADEILALSERPST